MIMRTFITLWVCTIVQFTTFAQESYTFTVKAGESIVDVMGPESIFRYPEFLESKVIYTDGTYTETLLNYNNVLGEMQFINSRGDTVIIANPEAIGLIVFPQDTFYVSDGYLELIAGDDSIKCVVKNYVKLRDVKNQGAYGMSSTANVDNYTSVSAGSNTSTYLMKSKQDIVYSMEMDYYIGSYQLGFAPARRNNILKLFPEYRDEIRDFIKKESINFNRQDDLILLTSYLADLMNL